jgi:hypothetical protein
MSPIPTSPAPAGSRGWRLVGQVKGWMMIATIVVLILAAFLVRPLIFAILSKNNLAASGVTVLYLEHTWLVIPLSIPALASCVPLVRGTRRAILWMTVGSLLTVVPLAFFMLGAIGGIAALYSSVLDG